MYRGSVGAHPVSMAGKVAMLCTMRVVGPCARVDLHAPHAYFGLWGNYFVETGPRSGVFFLKDFSLLIKKFMCFKCNTLVEIVNLRVKMIETHVFTPV